MRETWPAGSTTAARRCKSTLRAGYCRTTTAPGNRPSWRQEPVSLRPRPPMGPCEEAPQAGRPFDGARLRRLRPLTPAGHGRLLGDPAPRGRGQVPGPRPPALLRAVAHLPQHAIDLRLRHLLHLLATPAEPRQASPRPCLAVPGLPDHAHPDLTTPHRRSAVPRLHRPAWTSHAVPCQACPYLACRAPPCAAKPSPAWPARYSPTGPNRAMQLRTAPFHACHAGSGHAVRRQDVPCPSQPSRGCPANRRQALPRHSKPAVPRHTGRRRAPAVPFLACRVEPRRVEPFPSAPTHTTPARPRHVQ